MKQLLFWIGVWGLGLVGPSFAQSPGPVVVVSSTILADWAATLSQGSPIRVVSLLQPGDDPHVYEPTPQDSRQLAEADLILTHGHHLEPGILKMVRLSSAPHVAVGEGIPTVTDGGVPDPHLWGDVSRSQKMVEVIRQALLNLVSPRDQARIQENAAAYQGQLQALHEWIPQQIQTIPPAQRLLVTTHDAFQYYSRAYGIPVLGTLIGISTEEQPSAQTVATLVKAIRQAGVPTLFAETTLNPTLIATVAREARVQVWPTALYSDSLGSPDSPAGTYVGMMVSNTCAIVTGLGGTCQPWQYP